MNKQPQSTNDTNNQDKSKADLSVDQNINENIMAVMQTAFKLLKAVPGVFLTKYSFPNAYVKATLNEKLFMVRFMLEDLTINWDNYVHTEGL